MTAPTTTKLDEARDAINEDSSIVAEVLADTKQWCDDMDYALDTSKAEDIIAHWLASDAEGFHSMREEDEEGFYEEVYASAKGVTETLSDGAKLIESLSCVDQTNYDFMDSLLENMKLAAEGKPNKVGELLYSQVKEVELMKAAA